jgi:hypothetical protein
MFSQFVNKWLGEDPSSEETSPYFSPSVNEAKATKLPNATIASSPVEKGGTSSQSSSIELQKSTGFLEATKPQSPSSPTPVKVSLEKLPSIEEGATLAITKDGNTVRVDDTLKTTGKKGTELVSWVPQPETKSPVMGIPVSLGAEFASWVPQTETKSPVMGIPVSLGTEFVPWVPQTETKSPVMDIPVPLIRSATPANIKPLSTRRPFEPRISVMDMRGAPKKGIEPDAMIKQNASRLGGPPLARRTVNMLGAPKKGIEPDSWIEQSALKIESPVLKVKTPEEVYNIELLGSRKVKTPEEVYNEELLVSRKVKRTKSSKDEPSKEEVVRSIIGTYLSVPKKDKYAYYNAILFYGMPTNYAHMVTYEKTMSLDLKMFVDVLGLDKLNIHQADFYDLYHLLHYTGLDKAERNPYTKEELSVLSSLTQYELYEVIKKVRGGSDLKLLNNNHAYMLFYMLSGGLLPPVILEKEQKAKYDSFRDWNPFHILIYVLGNMDDYLSYDFSNYPPYHAAASMNKFLRKHIGTEYKLKSTRVSEAFLEFIAIIRSVTKEEEPF